MGRSRSTSYTDQTSTTTLPGFQQDAVNDYFAQLRATIGETGLRRDAYEGNLVADLTPSQQAAHQMASTFATGSGQQYANRVLDTSRYLLDPQNLYDPSRIPGFDASNAAMTRQVTENLTRNILPRTRSDQIYAGAYGDAGSAVADSLAIGETNKVIADQLAQNQQRQYLAGLEAMLAALSMSPGTMNVGTMPAEIMNLVGQQQQQQSQNEIDANVRRHEFQQNEPIEALLRMQQLVGSAGQYGGSTRTQGTTTTSNRPSTLQSLASIASIAAIPFTFGASAMALPYLNQSPQAPTLTPNTPGQNSYIPIATPSQAVPMPYRTPETPNQALGRSLSPLTRYA